MNAIYGRYKTILNKRNKMSWEKLETDCPALVPEWIELTRQSNILQRRQKLGNEIGYSGYAFEVWYLLLFF